jgi:hypothetical protein
MIWNKTAIQSLSTWQSLVIVIINSTAHGAVNHQQTYKRVPTPTLQTSLNN